jgi:hypothetical protein
MRLLPRPTNEARFIYAQLCAMGLSHSSNRYAASGTSLAVVRQNSVGPSPVRQSCDLSESDIRGATDIVRRLSDDVKARSEQLS